jgi:two-component system sensor histidine kinase KdpD
MDRGGINRRLDRSGPRTGSWPDWLASPLSRAAMPAVAVLGSFAATTVAIALVESPPLSIGDASMLYLLAVLVAAAFGIRAGVLAALVAFGLYDVLFVEPRFTLTVDDPREWLDLGLFLVVGVSIGRLAGGHSQRAAVAERDLREATSQFRISRTFATADSAVGALPAILEHLLPVTAMDRIRVTRIVGGREVTAAEAGGGPELEPGRIANVLARKPGETPARWVRAHRTTGPPGAPGPAADRAIQQYQVRIEADGETLGSLWATRRRGVAPPDAEETRVLSLAADQIGLALMRDRLAEEARDLEAARRREAVERALLESVSHDLRTPLASIRATAGSLADPSVDWTVDERRAAAARIDDEAARLNRLVENLLDLSRIEGGTIAVSPEAWELSGLVEPVIRRLAPELAPARVDLELPDDLPPVLVDPVLFDQALANVLENAAHHAPGATVTVRARREDDAIVLEVADDGPGVGEPVLARLFERFYRGPRTGDGSRRGLGIGLSVVKGAIESMGGTVAAERRAAGGLAIVFRLPIAPPETGSEA